MVEQSFNLHDFDGLLIDQDLYNLHIHHLFEVHHLCSFYV